MYLSETFGWTLVPKKFIFSKGLLKAVVDDTCIFLKEYILLFIKFRL